MKDMKNKWLILASAVAALATSSAMANTITPHSLVTPVTVCVNPVAVTWVYSADLSSGELHPGDSFTIFDFGDYVLGSIYAPASWTAVATVVGSDPAGVPLSPDNGEYNLRFTYTGASIQALGVTGLGLFGADTTGDSIIVDDWISRDHFIGNPGVVGDGGVGTLHRDEIIVPITTCHSVPDGGTTVLLLGAALSGLSLLKRKLAV